MNEHPENAEPKISKDELSDGDLAKVTGGGTNTTKTTTTKSGSGITESVSIAFTEVKFTYSGQ